MKKLVLVVITIVFFAVSFYCCDEDATCKDCKLRIYNNGILESEGDNTEYCDSDLKALNEGDSTTVLGETSIYICD